MGAAGCAVNVTRSNTKVATRGVENFTRGVLCTYEIAARKRAVSSRTISGGVAGWALQSWPRTLEVSPC